jgi:hypothetical protein
MVYGKWYDIIEIERVQRELAEAQANEARNKVAATMDDAIHASLVPPPVNSHMTRSTAASASSKKRKAMSSDHDDSDNSDSDDNEAHSNGNGNGAATSATNGAAAAPATTVVVKKQNTVVGSGVSAATALSLGINDTIDIDGITSTLVGDTPTTLATDDDIAITEAQLQAEIQRLEREMRHTAVPVVHDPRAIQREIKKLGTILHH